MILKEMSAKIDQQRESRINMLFNTAFYVASEGLAFRKFSGLLDLQEKNGLHIIGTQYRNEVQKSLFPAWHQWRGKEYQMKSIMPDSCVCLRMVLLARA